MPFLVNKVMVKHEGRVEMRSVIKTYCSFILCKYLVVNGPKFGSVSRKKKNFLTPEGAETFAAARQRPSCTGSTLEVLLAGAVHLREEGFG